MYEEEIHFGKLLLKQSETVLTHLTSVTMIFDPKSLAFLCCPGRVCGPSLRKVGEGVLQLLIGNEKVKDGQTDNMPSSSYKLLD